MDIHLPGELGSTIGIINPGDQKPNQLNQLWETYIEVGLQKKGLSQNHIFDFEIAARTNTQFSSKTMEKSSTSMYFR